VQSRVTGFFPARRRRQELSGVGGFEGSGGVRASSSSAAAYPPPPHPLYKENSHRIFVFQMDPTGQLRGVQTQGGPDPWTPLASYATARALGILPLIYWKATCGNTTDNEQSLSHLPTALVASAFTNALSPSQYASRTDILYHL